MNAARCLLWCGLLLLPGCSSRPSAIKPPSVNGASAAARAMELYDANKDGQLNAEELVKCPGVAKALAKWDTNGDGQVSADEFAPRVNGWFETGTALMNFSCRVTLDGQPLDGAQVVFELEPLFGDALLPCSGTSAGGGSVVLSIKPEDLPKHLSDLRGVVNPGLYKVRITHPTTAISARFNSETTLGQEISPREVQEMQVVFELASQ